MSSGIVFAPLRYVVGTLCVNIETNSQGFLGFIGEELSSSYGLTNHLMGDPLAQVTVSVIVDKDLYAKILLFIRGQNNTRVLRWGKTIADERCYYGYRCVFFEDDGYIVILRKSRVEIIAAEDNPLRYYIYRRIVCQQVIDQFHCVGGGFVVHGAAFAIGSEGVLVIVDSGSGKTSFFLTAMGILGAKATFLSCDRVVVTPSDTNGSVSLQLFASHDIIKCFPGCLEPFGCCSKLMGTIDPKLMWSQDSMLRLSFAAIREAFDVSAPSESIQLKQIVTLCYSKDEQSRVRKVPTNDENSADIVRRNLLLDERRNPNWLRFFVGQPDFKIISQLMGIRRLFIQWNSMDDLRDIICSIWRF